MASLTLANIGHLNRCSSDRTVITGQRGQYTRLLKPGLGALLPRLAEKYLTRDNTWDSSSSETNFLISYFVIGLNEGRFINEIAQFVLSRKCIDSLNSRSSTEAGISRSPTSCLIFPIYVRYGLTYVAPKCSDKARKDHLESGR